MGEQRRHYTREEKNKAAAIYASTASQQKTGEQTGIPRETIRHWVHNDEEFQEKIRSSQDVIDSQFIPELTSLIFDFIGKARSKMDDMSGRDLVWSAAVCLDKRQILQNKPTNISKGSDSVMKQLNELKQALEGQNKGADSSEGIVTNEEGRTDSRTSPANNEPEEPKTPVH